VSATRTIQFLLYLNSFERGALDRIVARDGYRNASEALRYLIRREDDPDLGEALTQIAKCARCGNDGNPCSMCGAGGQKRIPCDPVTGDELLPEGLTQDPLDALSGR